MLAKLASSLAMQVAAAATSFLRFSLRVFALVSDLSISQSRDASL